MSWQQLAPEIGPDCPALAMTIQSGHTGPVSSKRDIFTSNSPWKKNHTKMHSIRLHLIWDPLCYVINYSISI